jgi:hypothetical protein
MELKDFLPTNAKRMTTDQTKALLHVVRLPHARNLANFIIPPRKLRVADGATTGGNRFEQTTPT